MHTVTEQPAGSGEGRRRTGTVKTEVQGVPHAEPARRSAAPAASARPVGGRLTAAARRAQRRRFLPGLGPLFLTPGAGRPPFLARRFAASVPRRSLRMRASSLGPFFSALYRSLRDPLPFLLPLPARACRRGGMRGGDGHCAQQTDGTRPASGALLPSRNDQPGAVHHVSAQAHAARV